MRMVDIIEKKRDGEALTSEEIRFFVSGYARGEIPDYQAAALLMAIYFQGMNERETSDLTEAIVASGETVDLSEIEGVKVDKHSTGGVGDKTSLIVGPLVAAAGIPIAKMSGRGLGHTGGTIDKLESIPGFHVELSREAFLDHVNRYKIAIIGQSQNLTPADKKLYALRDVTGTVASVPLIASSIMSKKLASGADVIVLDVKVGSGAFMKTLDDAKRLAEVMVGIGKSLGRRTIAILSDMDEPLGREVGNANEVREAIDVLKGKGDARLTELCLTIATQMTLAAGVYAHEKEARDRLTDLIVSGRALETLKTFVQAQGGDPAVIDDPGRLPSAAHSIAVRAERDGFVQAIDAESVGLAAMMLGAGRKTKDDVIDHGVGVSIEKKVGDAVKAGETLAVLHSRTETAADAYVKLKNAYRIGDEKAAAKPIVYEVIQ